MTMSEITYASTFLLRRRLKCKGVLLQHQHTSSVTALRIDLQHRWNRRGRDDYSKDSSSFNESEGCSIKNSDADFFSRFLLLRFRKATARCLVFDWQPQLK